MVENAGRAVVQSEDSRVDNFVVPLMVGLVRPKNEHPVTAESVEGTGFLLAGGRGLGLTARHVAEAIQRTTSVEALVAKESEIDEARLPAAGFVDSRGFRCAPIVAWDLHPTEDLALFRLIDDDYYSPYTIDLTKHYGAAEYCLWGYPDDVRYDYFTEEAQPLNVAFVYSGGHVRRRIDRELPISAVRGQKFYELSTPAGACCSGAPVAVRSNPWQAIGVYVGERRNETGSFAVGFATRADAIAEQWPQLVDGSGHLSALCPASRTQLADPSPASRFWADVNSRL
jgi:hypothetical protein